MRRFAVAIVMLLAACGAAGPVCETSVIVETVSQSCISGADCDTSNSSDLTLPPPAPNTTRFQPKGVRQVDYTYAVTICTHPDGTVTSSKERVP